jgi:hypothetical protein
MKWNGRIMPPASSLLQPGATLTLHKITWLLSSRSNGQNRKNACLIQICAASHPVSVSIADLNGRSPR